MLYFQIKNIIHGFLFILSSFNTSTMGGKFKFAIDRGGTFTDIYAKCPNGEVRVMKLLSVDPTNYSDAPREGIRRILEMVKIIYIITMS